MAAVIENRLFWAPETDAEPAASATGSVRVSALRLCCEHPDDAAAAEAVYSIPHYALGSIGRAFGPLALDQTLWFCFNLEEKLNEHGSVTLYTCPGREQARSNAAVMLGAYLVLRHAWSVDRVVDALGAEEAARRFICSFATVNRPEPIRNLRIQECWAGMALARDRKWLDAKCVTDRASVTAACRRHRRMVDQFDAAWLIPGRVMVAADPTTTSVDPNPATVKYVFPPTEADRLEMMMKEKDVADSGGPSFMSESTATPTSTTDNFDFDTRAAWPEGSSTCSSVHGTPITQQPKAKQAAEASFVGLLTESGVSVVIRTNSLQERGMLSRSYDGRRLGAFGINHKDITLEDGGCPSKNDVAEALHATASAMESKDEAILVHCKGGFGRSVTVACCVIIEHLDIPGPVLLGWVRMARPGAINTPQQERFLQSLGGRADLRRFVQTGGQAASCGPGCSVM